jgi:hypothetical protein
MADEPLTSPDRIVSASDSIVEIARALVEDPEYRRRLTEQIETRTADQALVQRLIAYARERQATKGQAMARKVLTEAGVSWEAL